MQKTLTWMLPVLAVLAPALADAHSFGRIYNLPVPFWMYAWGAGAALILSFVVVGYFAHAAAPDATRPRRELTQPGWLPPLSTLLKWLSVGCLLLCLLTGFFGSRDPYRNFSMTFFWVVFLLGFAYLTALTVDFYAVLNPWRVLTHAIARIFRSYTAGRWRYPRRLAYWPALAFYMAFIWIELFAHMQPQFLAQLLLAYTLINLAGVWLVGAGDWFTHCEFFCVFFRLLGKIAPVERTHGGHLVLRAPFSGLLRKKAAGLSELLFVLFMLSSTAFDGLHATAPWVQLFWLDPYNLITPLTGTPPIQALVQLRPWYLAWETLCLLLSPFLYLVVYLGFLALARRLVRTPLSLRELALRFAYSLLPIALVYHVTHYYTLLLTQGTKIYSLLSDPFGWGWNLFLTAGQLRAPILPGMDWVWHTQVGLILFGHIVSVCVAHLEALRCFPTRREATLSQLPMLALMLVFTTVGLWILSQPIQYGY